jgi:type VI secretion system protein ImpB
MPPNNSIHAKLGRVRPPRVHIVYEVHTGGEPEMRELPFVMGVLGDFTGMPVEPLAELKDRNFVGINPDNFDDVLASMQPHLAFSVPNTLGGDPAGSRLMVDLHFRRLADFDPDQVAQQVEPLRRLIELRTKLADLRANLQGNDKLDAVLQAALRSDDDRERLRQELTAEPAAEGPTDG